MKTRTTRLALTHSEGTFEVEIVDEGTGEYVMVSCGPFEQNISIDPSEWPFLRDAIDRMFEEIAENECGGGEGKQAPPAETNEPTANEADWIPWNGGERPVGKKSRVAVKFRSADICESSIASDLRWEWAGSGSPSGWDSDNDIVAYKVVG